jgi:hypothetical protein
MSIIFHLHNGAYYLLQAVTVTNIVVTTIGITGEYILEPIFFAT